MEKFNSKLAKDIETYESGSISDEDKEKIEKLNEQSLDESKTLKSQWEKRGRIMNILNKYM